MLAIEYQDAVATIRLNHGAVNALDLELLMSITEAIHDLDAQPDIGAIVLTGQGRAFCAGVDLKRILESDQSYIDSFLHALSDAFLAPLRCDTPVVAAVNGHAIAGGAVLAAACDRVIGTDDERARIGLAEMAVGVPFPTVAIEIMRQRLGGRLSDSILSAALYPPVEAHRRGFLDTLSPPDNLADHVQAAAAALAAVPVATMSLTKKHLRAPIEAVVNADGDKHDARMRELWSSDGVRSAIAAFVTRTLGPAVPEPSNH